MGRRRYFNFGYDSIKVLEEWLCIEYRRMFLNRCDLRFAGHRELSVPDPRGASSRRRDGRLVLVLGRWPAAYVAHACPTINDSSGLRGQPCTTPVLTLVKSLAVNP